MYSAAFTFNDILYGVGQSRVSPLKTQIWAKINSISMETVCQCQSWNRLTKAFYWWLESDVTPAWHYVIITSSPSQVGPPSMRCWPYGVTRGREGDWTWTRHCYPTLALTKAECSYPLLYEENTSTNKCIPEAKSNPWQDQIKISDIWPQKVYVWICYNKMFHGFIKVIHCDPQKRAPETQFLLALYWSLIR